LQVIERSLRRFGFAGYGGGIALFVVLASVSMTVISGLIVVATTLNAWLGAAVHLFFLFSLLALGALLQHGRRIENALQDDDVPRARVAVSQLVGRDTEPMDAGACRRAAVESLSENLTDGVVSPILWYAVGGMPLLVLFKVVSTMDSMVGYKTPEYVRFGWCGARLDDLMNYVPARVTWLIIAGVAALMPGCSGPNALRSGWSDHAVLPSPNSGWSEAAAAGALHRRLIGPIWRSGQLVTTVWIGNASDPPLSSALDYERAARLVAACGTVTAALATALIVAVR
jgi:adenosylcobinamide-phosphate synthase